MSEFIATYGHYCYYYLAKQKEMLHSWRYCAAIVTNITNSAKPELLQRPLHCG